MKQVRIQLSEAAAADVLEQADWYASQSDEDLPQKWESAVSATLLQIVEFPGSGALCHFMNPVLRDVRRTPVEGFPKHLIFYQTEAKALFVLRIVHGARDLESLF